MFCAKRVSIFYGDTMMLKQYLKKILEVARRGDAREESYYSTLEGLIGDSAKSQNRKDIRVTSQPKKTDAGNPDFRVWDGKQRIIGYLEAKTPDKNLDDEEETEQIRRYKTTFPNFILTNFFEFRLFKNGLTVDKLRIANPNAIYSLKGTPSVENEEQFGKLLKKFFSYSFPSITSAQPLAVELAKRTRFLRDEVIAEELREEEKNGLGKILGFYEAFQTYLIRGLTKEQFADLYSQTITYGLFASRMRCEGEFNRKHAVDDIPRSIGILREMFDYISLGDLPSQLEWIVDEISNVLANVDVKKIFSEYYKNKRGEDPVFHFYETFLEEYDPKERERRGVYYTPKPVVSYIVCSLHSLLKEKFGLDDGLANENVTILDPAAGTLTFIVEAIKQAINEFTSKYGEGGKEGFIKEHILRNFYAFELMIAPYAIGHLKVSFLLDELGYKLQDEDVKFYLTNTLELEDIEQTSLPGMASLARESRKAGEVKKRIPILIILGNPPYSVSSANKSEFIEKEMELYKEDVHDEKNIQPLSDDYIKFIRFAHWKIEKNGKGVIGYISNNSYLSGIIHRGMRKKLLDAFDEIYILNLHGSSRIEEKAPEGKDKNVFDIQQGVAVTFYVKSDEPSKKKRVYYADLWGERDEKYQYLLKNSTDSTTWKQIKPKKPYYFFVPKDFALKEKYDGFWKITKIFKKSQIGLMTGQDKFFIDSNPKMLKNRILSLFDKKISDEELKDRYNLKSQAGEKTIKARNSTIFNEEIILPYCYRPFDIRYVYAENKFLWRSVETLKKHFNRENIALVTTRILAGIDFNHVFVAQHIGDNTFISSKTKERNYFFPLYLYNNTFKRKMDSKNSVRQGRQLNFTEEFLKTMEKNFQSDLSGEEIFCYIYAILHSHTYRKSYKEFLKIDFPRIPFTTEYNLFRKIGELGKKLVDLHLLKSKSLNKPIAKFQGKGDKIVKKTQYIEEKGRIYINKTQYFEGIEQGVWEYQIGGYQVLHKWLKDRKSNELTLKEIKHYCRVATTIKETIEIQEEIDKLYPYVEKDIIEFKEKKQNASLDKYNNS
jgi:predicted helicase